VMAKRSMRDALLNQDKKYDYGMILPFKTRRGMDEDQLSTDYMEGDISPAVPELLSDMYNASVKGGQMVQGERKIEPFEVTKIAAEFLPGAMAVNSTASKGMKGAILGANVFQGGPHKYGAEGAAKSLDHMSKGEGAQAYGYGRYDAGAEGVARDYKINVPHQDIKRSFLKELPEDAEIEDVMGLLGKGHFSEKQERVIRALNDDDWLGFEYPASAISAVYSKNIDNWDPSDVLRRAVDDAGYLYKHDLPDDDIARYMDWDKPLSEQPESVRKALEGVGIRYDATARARADELIKRMAEMAKDRLPDNRMREEKEWFRLSKERDALIEQAADPTGDKIYQSLVDKSGALDWPVGSDRAAREAYRDSAKQAASEALGKAGIPGLQYYDGMSRNAGEGTRNYVTWDQDVLDRMKLLERNGESMIDALR